MIQFVQPHHAKSQRIFYKIIAVGNLDITSAKERAIDPNLKEDEARDIVSQFGALLSKFKLEYREDEAIVIAAIRNYPDAIMSAHTNLQHNKTVLLEYLKSSKSMSPEGKPLTKEAISWFWDHYRPDPSLNFILEDNAVDPWSDMDIMIQVLAFDGLLLEHTSDSLKGNEKLVLIALGNNIDAFSFASHKLQSNPSFLLDSCSRYPELLRQLDDSLLDNQEFWLNAIENNSEITNYLPKQLQADKSFLYKAILKNWRCIKKIKQSVITYRMVMAAIYIDPNALSSVPERFRSMEPVVHAAALKDPGVLNLDCVSDTLSNQIEKNLDSCQIEDKPYSDLTPPQQLIMWEELEGALTHLEDEKGYEKIDWDGIIERIWSFLDYVGEPKSIDAKARDQLLDRFIRAHKLHCTKTQNGPMSWRFLDIYVESISNKKIEETVKNYLEGYFSSKIYTQLSSSMDDILTQPLVSYDKIIPLIKDIRYVESFVSYIKSIREKKFPKEDPIDPIEFIRHATEYTKTTPLFVPIALKIIYLVSNSKRDDFNSYRETILNTLKHTPGKDIVVYGNKWLNDISTDTSLEPIQSEKLFNEIFGLLKDILKNDPKPTFNMNVFPDCYATGRRIFRVSEISLIQ